VELEICASAALAADIHTIRHVAVDYATLSAARKIPVKGV
jgi:hypothetical protein